MNGQCQLRILSWNSRALSCKTQELANFLNKNPHDILLISETHLKQEINFSFLNYKVYRVDRRWGGVAILIKPHIPHSGLKIISYNFGEAMSIIIDDPIQPFRICVVYISPAANRNQSKKFFNEILSIPGSILTSGDFNMKHPAWNNISYSLKGKDFYDICNFKKYNIHPPDGPTIIPSNPNSSPSSIDFAVSKNMQGISQLKVLNEMSSDHMPVSFTINSRIDEETFPKFFNFKKANWKKFITLMNDDSDDILCNSKITKCEDIDGLVDKVTDSINKSLQKSVPKSRVSMFRHASSTEIERLNQKRNFYRNKYKSTLLLHWKSAFNQTNRMIKKKTTELLNSNREIEIGGLTHKDNSLWKKTKYLKKKRFPIPPLKTQNGSFVYCDSDKSQVFADSFKSAHEITQHCNSPHNQKVKNSTDILNNTPIDPKKFIFTNEEIKSTLSSLNVKKAVGPDKIPNQGLKKLQHSKSTIQLLQYIFNACMRLSYFPPKWKVAKICAIPKKAQSSSNPKDYRPISLLSCLGKVFEILILKKLNEFESTRNIFIKQQFGFRHRHSTIQQVLRITKSAAVGFNKNQSTGMVMLDLEKAFDSVWHDGIIYKLLKFKYPIEIVKLIHSYLTNRSAFVELNGFASTTFDIPAGVPQGSILSPHLFNIFINDIPIPQKGELAIYADDTAFFSNSSWKNLKSIKKSLLKTLKTTHNYFESWKIRLNSEKTEFIIFTKSTKMIKKMDEDEILFNGQKFLWSENVKYLGIHLDRKLKFDHHLKIALIKAKSLAFSTCYCLLKKGNSLPSSEKINIYRSIIRPVLSYGAPVYSHAAKSHLKKHQTFQNQILRMALNVQWDSFTTNKEIHTRAKVPTLEEYHDNIIKRFYERCSEHSNGLVHTLGNHDMNALQIHRVKHKLPKI